MSLVYRFFLFVFAVLIASYAVPGVTVDGFGTAAIVAVLLGLLNLTARPILFVLTLPLTILTLGLFTFVLNAALFWFVASFVEGFAVDGFLPALIGAMLVTVVRWIGHRLDSD